MRRTLGVAEQSIFQLDTSHTPFLKIVVFSKYATVKTPYTGTQVQLERFLTVDNVTPDQNGVGHYDRIVSYIQNCLVNLTSYK